jgi:hypothetical protein
VRRENVPSLRWDIQKRESGGRGSGGGRCGGLEPEDVVIFLHNSSKIGFGSKLSKKFIKYQAKIIVFCFETNNVKRSDAKKSIWKQNEKCDAK